MDDKKNKETPPSDHPLKGKAAPIRINEMGMIERDYNIDEVNDFLNKNVPDRKLDEANEEPKED
jgi:hypothetical protein